MVRITSNKPSVDFAAKSITIGKQTAPSVLSTGTYANVGNGLSIVIPETGLYRIICQCQADLSYTANPSHHIYTRLAVDGAEIDGTCGVTYKNVSSGSLDIRVHTEAPTQEFTVGQIISLQAYKSSTDGAQIFYSAGVYEGFIQAELLSKVITVQQIPVPPANAVIAGEVKMWPASTAPAGYLLCDGGSYAVALYPDLFAVIGYTWGGGGASFNVPDMRGGSPTGAGTSVGYTYNETIALAAKYNDQMQWHEHEGDANTGGSDGNGRGFTGGRYGFPYAGAPSWPVNVLNSGPPVAGYGGYGAPRTGYVTKGKQVGINFIIKT